MEGVARLLARAWLAHLKVELNGNDLHISGPRSAAAIVDEISARKLEVVAHLQSRGCGSLYLQPGKWVHREGRATCPICGRFMGYVRTNGGHDGSES